MAANLTYDFIDRPPELICPICFEVAINDPCQHAAGKDSDIQACGTVFCRACIHQDVQNVCPTCRGPPNYPMDKRAEEKAFNLRVRCCNKEHGCSWEGTARHLRGHLEEDCGFVSVRCKYTSIGCKEQTYRKDVQVHEQDVRKHFDLALERIQAVRKCLNSQHREFHTLKEGASLVFKVPDYLSIKRSGKLFFSEPFYSHPGGYHMRIFVDVKGSCYGTGSHMSVFVEMLEGPYDSSLKWPFCGIIWVDLLNQLADNKHFGRTMDVTIPCAAQVGSFCGISQFIAHSGLQHNRANKTQYLMDDALFFKIAVQVDSHRTWLDSSIDLGPAIKRNIERSRTLTQEKVIVFQVSNFTLRKASNDIFISEQFFSGPSGYKMCVKLYSNGDGTGRGTHISVYLQILMGPYDDILQWPYTGMVVFELLNHLKNGNHCRKVLEYRDQTDARAGSILGIPQFVDHALLASTSHRKYLDGDSVHLCVTVNTTSHSPKPWLHVEKLLK